MQSPASPSPRPRFFGHGPGHADRQQRAIFFDSVPPGGYSVSVNKPGYQGRGNSIGPYRGNSFHPQRPEPPPRVQVGPDMPSVTLFITPLATIAGHVTLSTADPADGIRIQAFGRRIENGRPRWAWPAEARTRSDGSLPHREP